MYLIPIAACFIASLFNGSMIARTMGQRGAVIVGIVCLVVAFVSSAVIWFEVVVMGCPVSLDLLGTWFHVGSFHASWTLNFDMLTAHMLFTVTGVSMAVHMYAADYMRADPHQNLFMSYLSMFTGFMLVLVAADNLMLMLVGWEGIFTCCPNGISTELYAMTFFSPDGSLRSATSSSTHPISLKTLGRGFYTSRIPADKRSGPHSSLFKQLMTGLLLGDGWLEKHGRGVRLGVSLTAHFRDVAQWLLNLLYGLGYTDRTELGLPLQRSKVGCKPYYQLRTFSFASLLTYYNMWYASIAGRVVKLLPSYGVLYELLTPLALAVWVMGDGSGMLDGGFKISSHSFNHEQNQMLCDILRDKYGIIATVVKDRHLCHIRIWKRSVPLLYALVKPYLQPSCEYKFRHVRHPS